MEFLYKNGKHIYDTLNMFTNIPAQVVNEKIHKLFNTNNEIRNIFFIDSYINELENIVKNQCNKNDIIKHIIFCLQPIIHQNTKGVNVEEYKNIIKHTLYFKVTYMKNIDSQLEFIFNPQTIHYIQSKIKYDLQNNKNIDINYINSILKNNIDSHTRNKKDINSNNISVKYNVYINQATLFTERELFHIIDKTIILIKNKTTTENNNIKQHQNMSKWNTVLGHNDNDIRQNINVKLNDKRPKGMQFNMNY